jgi:hypothetical protein
MKLTAVVDEHYLYQIEDFFPKDIAQQVIAIPWLDLPYNRLEIGNSRRRNLHLDHDFLDKAGQYIRTVLKPQIEDVCKVKFLEHSSVNWWLDEPGFRPRIHHDGDVQANALIYWLPVDRQDLGTSFYHDQEAQQVIYRFANRPNTGYLMFHPKYHANINKLLWHDMERSVPEGVTRLVTHVWFGSYSRVI